MKYADEMFDVGIIGDGQLAKMLAECKTAEGLQIGFLGKDPEGPTKNLGIHIDGDIFNSNAILTFAENCKICTFENEFIDFEALLKSQGSNYLPKLESILAVGDKLSEKNYIKDLGIPLGEFSVRASEEIQHFPAVVKSIKGAYDGYGTYLIRSQKDLYDFHSVAKEEAYLLEDMLPIEKELAITACRFRDGDVLFYPLVHTVQINGKCDRVEFPSNCSPQLELQAQEYTKRLMDALDYVGVMSLEFFKLKSGELFYNECSPRPHNSAHYTMDAFNYSQFDLHLCAVLGKEKPQLRKKTEAAVMINLLGNKDCGELDSFPDEVENAFYHSYAKPISRPGRKMGHLNLLGEDVSALVLRADELRKRIRI